MGAACGNKLEEYDIIPPFADDDLHHFGAASPLRSQGTGTFAWKPEHIAEEYWWSQIAAAKGMNNLTQKASGYCMIDAASVYGAAVALPQVARTASWSLTYTGMCMRGYLCLILNVALQGFLLYMLSKEERIMAKFAGKMSLCDFGAQLYTCPEGSNCRGPGGTEITPERLYSFDVWSIRVYIRESLKLIMPDKAAEIDAQIDPGEYGVESYYLRLTCCFIFVLGLWPDLLGSVELAYLLYHLPTKAMPWMQYDKAADPKEEGSVSFQVNGMPLHWKIINVVFVLLPKLYIWFLTADIGIVFLLETPTIEAMVINAVALGFILSIDETLICGLMPPAVKILLSSCQEYALFENMGTETDRQAYQENAKDTTWSARSPQLYAQIVPPRLFFVFLITSFVICKYYTENCTPSYDGGLVSTPVHLPKSSQMSFLSFLFGPFPNMFHVDVVTDSVWEMPE
jgi:hypothetical protein